MFKSVESFKFGLYDGTITCLVSDNECEYYWETEDDANLYYIGGFEVINIGAAKELATNLMNNGYFEDIIQTMVNND